MSIKNKNKMNADYNLRTPVGLTPSKLFETKSSPQIPTFKMSFFDDALVTMKEFTLGHLAQKSHNYASNQ